MNVITHAPERGFFVSRIPLPLDMPRTMVGARGEARYEALVGVDERRHAGETQGHGDHVTLAQIRPLPDLRVGKVARFRRQRLGH